MQIITVINAKGGCGKSTIAMSLASGLALRGYQTLLIDMDPQAQVTQWLGLGDGLSSEGTLVAAMDGRQTLDSVVQNTKFENLSFIASSQGLEDLGRQITDREDYATVFTGLMASLTRPVDLVVIDSPRLRFRLRVRCKHLLRASRRARSGTRRGVQVFAPALRRFLCHRHRGHSG